MENGGNIRHSLHSVGTEDSKATNEGGVSRSDEAATGSSVPPGGGYNLPTATADPNENGTEEVLLVAILQQPPRPVCKAAAAASSAGTQTEEEVPMSGDAQVVYDEKVEKNLNGVQTEDDTRNLADCKAPIHDMSVACARMVASSWAAESGIFTNCDGELEINECKTPDDLVKWKTRNGVRKGSYRLRGKRAGIRGDINISLTMDELFTVMSGIKNPKCGEADAALFGEESDVEDFDDDSSDEDYQPG